MIITNNIFIVKGKGERRLLALAGKERLVRILEKMLDENEFLSEHGIRSYVLPTKFLSDTRAKYILQLQLQIVQAP